MVRQLMNVCMRGINPAIINFIRDNMCYMKKDNKSILQMNSYND
jgi:hypothetical protein